ncbi:MAG: hypothetical protein KTR35_16155 [Gammaproteobacteria bacterium]|nr:hypothetical protein [Gammaproteobacteria bacterium]
MLRYGIVTVIVSGLITGCSLIGTKNEPIVQADALIAKDFVRTMAQIAELEPTRTTLQFSRMEEAADGFSQQLQRQAVQYGYGIQLVNGHRGGNHVRYEIAENLSSLSGDTATYTVSVGDIALRREYYALPSGAVSPRQVMMVRGADISNVVVDDSLFTEQSPAQTDRSADALVAQSRNGGVRPQPPSQSVQTIAQPLPEPVVAQQSVAPAPQSNILDETQIAQADVPATNQITPIMAKPKVEPKEPLGSFTLPGNRNIVDIGGTNFAAAFENSSNVTEEILMFDNDSLVLGKRNKSTLSEMAKKFDPETDVVSVVGCSIGYSNIENGNSYLANGRASRVKEALLYQGIPNESILDEGCWASEPGSAPFPSRGVVVTIKRRNS